jgi:hypothetical protein
VQGIKEKTHNINHATGFGPGDAAASSAHKYPVGDSIKLDMIIKQIVGKLLNAGNSITTCI